MRAQARIIRLVVAFSASMVATALAISGATHADSVESGIEVSLAPALEVVAIDDGARVFAVSTGAAIQLAVVAKLSDGTSRDVTVDAATTYVSLSPEAASVDASGRIVIAQSIPTADAAVLIVVSRATFTAPVALRVTPD